ncbi:MAG: hypothetical protein J6Y47_10225 [Bacteroidales bacterium]|nr:hypothetical protein [Bacteroidales bacterium]
MAEKKKTGYDWKFVTIGGTTRVSIESGKDLQHLHELDQKLWTVLSCPVKGLELDENTLSLMDGDKDGKIRVQEVLDAVQWLLKVVKKPDVLLRQEDFVPLDYINCDTEEGLKIHNSAQQILNNLGLNTPHISIADTADSMAIFAQTKFNGDGIIVENSTDDEKLKKVIADCIATLGAKLDRSGADGIDSQQIEDFYTLCGEYKAWRDAGTADAEHVYPYGDNTEDALNAYMALKDKVNDFFMRCKLIAFNADTSSVLDVQVSKVEEISGKNLAECNDEIAAYPLARANNRCELPLNEGINPAWKAAFADLKRLILDTDFAGKAFITEDEWLALERKFQPYIAWKADKKGEQVETLGLDRINEILSADEKEALLALIEQDKALETEANEIASVDKFLHFYRDIYQLIKNFVTFADFYDKDRSLKSIFQAGTLYIDQRSCDLCLKVSDMSKHNTMVADSGMFLIYCDCTSKQKNATMTIVAAMTQGEVDELVVGKNAIFYDRHGLDWDAVVTKIVDNPISIKQAFWSPYRKCSRFITEQINKFAADKDTKMTGDLTNTISDTGSTLTDANAQQPKESAGKQAFDMSKFLGLFAVIGMALGTICGFLLQLVQGFAKLQWYKMVLVLIAIVLVISGPSMIIAWLKLRKRNLSPILNANGWAINAKALVNIPFGATLTQMAKYPKVTVSDPFADKGLAWWKKALIWIALLGGIFAALYFTDTLAKVGLPFHKEQATEAVVEEAVVEEVVAPVEEEVIEEVAAE